MITLDRLRTLRFIVTFIVCQLIPGSFPLLHGPPGHPSTGGQSRFHSPLWGQGLPIPNPLHLLSSSGLGYPVFYVVFWAPHRGLSRYTRRLWAGNCCLRHPFSPVLEPRQGGDICSLAGLTWPHVIIPATMSSLQYRHGAPPRHGAMCRGPPSGGFSGRWVFIRALPVHSLPTIAHYMVLCLYCAP